MKSNVQKITKSLIGLEISDIAHDRYSMPLLGLDFGIATSLTDTHEIRIHELTGKPLRFHPQRRVFSNCLFRIKSNGIDVFSTGMNFDILPWEEIGGKKFQSPVILKSLLHSRVQNFEMKEGRIVISFDNSIELHCYPYDDDKCTTPNLDNYENLVLREEIEYENYIVINDYEEEVRYIITNGVVVECAFNQLPNRGSEIVRKSID